MKKLAIILALLLVPMTAFGMDTISDSDLDAVTGQAGVSIALNSIQIQTSGGTTSYGDPDSGRWISITGSVTAVTKTIGFHAKYNPWDMSNTLGTGGTNTGGVQTNLNFDTLTIDIVDISEVDGWNLVSMVVASDRAAGNGNAAVKITLPDMILIEATQDQTKTIWLGTDKVPNDTNAEELIQIYSTAGTTRIVAADMGSNWAAYQANGLALYLQGGYNATLAFGGGVNYNYYSGMNTSILIGAHD
jgi:uncharacterized protein DUF6160